MTVLLLIAAPLAAAVVLTIAGSRGPRALAATIAVAAPAFAFGAALAIAQGLSDGRDAIAVDLGSWLPLRGASIALRAEPAAVPLLITLAAVATVAAILALREQGTSARFFVPLELLLAGALGVVVAANLVVLLIAWGIAGVAVAQLARRDASAAAARDGSSALVLARLGDTCLLLATIALLALAQTVDLAELTQRLGGVTLVPSAQRIVAASSLLIAVATAARAGLIPFTPWVPDPGHASRSVTAALTFAAPIGALLVVRLAPLMDATTLNALVGLSAATAIVTSITCLGRPRASHWRAAAEAAAAIAAAPAGTAAVATVVIASLVARTVGVVARDSRLARLDGLASVAVLALAAALSASAPLVAAMLAIAALSALVATLLGSETGRVAAIVARAGESLGAVEGSFASIAAIVERGGDGFSDALAIVSARAVTWTNARVRALGEANEWVSGAVVLAGAVAIVVFWASR